MRKEAGTGWRSSSLPGCRQWRVIRVLIVDRRTPGAKEASIIYVGCVPDLAIVAEPGPASKRSPAANEHKRSSSAGYSPAGYGWIGVTGPVSPTRIRCRDFVTASTSTRWRHSRPRLDYLLKTSGARIVLKRRLSGREVCSRRAPCVMPALSGGSTRHSDLPLP